jgi:DnaJ family protein C protein 17
LNFHALFFALLTALSAEIFIKLKKAHEVLLHEDQRKAYDAKIQARILKKKKREEMTAGRRKLKDDLVMRESLHKRQKTSEEAEVKVREAEIQRLREEGRRKREQEQSKRAEAEATASRKSNNDANTGTNPTYIHVACYFVSSRRWYIRLGGN